MSSDKKKFPTRILVILAMYAALASVLMLLEFPLSFLFPTFLKVDFSNLPVLLASFHFGPLAGIAVALIKNLIHLTASTTAGVGELANFIISAVFAGVAGLIYRFRKTKRGAVAGLVFGGLAMTLAAIFSNYFITIPFFSAAFGFENIIKMCSDLIPFVNTKWDVVLLSITPFNLFMGVLIGGLTLLLYKRVRGLLK